MIETKGGWRLKLEYMKKDWQVYLFLLPAISLVFLFIYTPMYGVLLAFKDYMPRYGITGSPWLGFSQFERFFNSYQFWRILKNTIILNIYSLLWNFPIPVILALMLNQLKHERYKKFIQTSIYAPYFISQVVIVGMLMVFLSPRTGLINNIIVLLGGESNHFMATTEWFRTIFISSGIWQTAGYSSIIYLAALSGINPELHEAAMIDGASKFKRILNVDLPALVPTIIILFILNMGHVMNIGFEKIFLMQNPLNLPVSQVISTYVYKIGLIDGDFGFSTAINLFNSLINLILLFMVNTISKKFSEVSLW